MRENEKADDIGIAAIFCWENAKWWVKRKVVKTGTGRERIKDIVYTPFLDLEEQYYIGESGNGCTATITVTEGLLQSWGITKEELEKQAAENMAAEGYSMVAVDRILRMEPLPESDRMYVVTNRKGFFGAAIITEPELLAQFAEMLGGDVFVLPSSLHEVILIPATTSHTPWSLGMIVREVNRIKVPEEDILSDSVYYFRADTKTVEVIAEKMSSRAVGDCQVD